jgi:RNA polymerase sigma factor (sigma-70 family)
MVESYLYQNPRHQYDNECQYSPEIIQALRRSVRIQTVRYGMQYDDVEDCTSAFLCHMLEERDAVNGVGQAASPIRIRKAIIDSCPHALDSVAAQAWIARCAINFCHNWQRSERRRLHHEQNYSICLFANFSFDDALSETPSLVMLAPTVEDEVFRRLQRSELRSALKLLPKRHAYLLVQHYINGESLSTLACELSTTPGAVQQLLLRLRRKLREMLKFV